ncbi:MAG: beta-ketoacyl-[acyl-carrier-protein] synthase family protein [Niabella sp.]
MKEVYFIADNIVSPLGVTTNENFTALCRGRSAVTLHHDVTKSNIPFMADLLDDAVMALQVTNGLQGLTRFEQLLAISIRSVIAQSGIDVTSKKTALIISSTKGNISLLENNKISKTLKEQVSLPAAANKIADFFNLVTKPIVVSHACISGLVAIITAKRMLQAGLYENIIVAGADIITKFILSGFQSFQAVSDELCKPFDANRKGINLGEAAATVLLSVNKPEQNAVELAGGAISNDANHISGPSRTGRELFQAIDAALQESAIPTTDIDFISAHGTATMYNDDMESKAINLAGLQAIPVNSLKGYFGHTLGAAGLLEVIISLQSLKDGKIIPTKGFETAGTAEPLNICHTLIEKQMSACLKTASGFGGCNAAVIIKKHNII